MPNSKSGLTKVALIIGVVLLAVVVLFGYLAITAGNFVSSRLDYVTQSLASRAGVSVFLVKGVVLIVTIPFFMALAKMAKGFWGLLSMASGPALDPLEIYRSKAGLTVVIYCGVFWVAMWAASRQAYAYKFCAVTPEGIFTADSPGKDPIYGVDLKPCTPDQAKILRNKHGELQGAQEISMRRGQHVPWFNAATGQPQVWYVKRDDGYHFFDAAGSDPDTGDLLKAVTHDIVRQFVAQQHATEALQLAERTRETQAERDKAAASRAQTLFDSKNYKDALHACQLVLSHDPANDTCSQIKRDALVDWAHKLVDDGQTQLQRAEYDAALRDAEQAMSLDPSNEPAKQLKSTAILMKKQYSLN